MTKYPFKPFAGLPEYSDEERIQLANDFYAQLRQRRTIRDFSADPIPEVVIRNCICGGHRTQCANLQPWHFALVKDPQIKKQIRIAAEKEEYEFYNGKAPQDWLDALAPLGTDDSKPFLEIAPYLIVIFMQTHFEPEGGKRVKHYYASESVGIATGMLISALHHCGIATLTHTPSPMKFLNEILGRPSYERPFLILVTGYPADDATVPDISKKPYEEIVSIH